MERYTPALYNLAYRMLGDGDEAADIAVLLTSEVSLDLIVAIDDLAELSDLDVGEVSHSGARIQPGLLDYLSRVVLPDSINGRESVKDRLVAR